MEFDRRSVIVMPDGSVKERTMSDKRRDLMHRVMGSEFDLVPTLHVFSHYKYCDEVLGWLIKFQWTGKTLKEVLALNFENNPHWLVKHVIDAHNAGIRRATERLYNDGQS